MRDFIPPSRRRPQRGFTLVEVLTVAAIVAILATVALASMRQSRAVALEASAVGVGKTLATAEYQYFARNKSFGRFDQLQAEGDLVDPRYDPGDDLSRTTDSPIAPFYSVQVRLRTDTFRISLVPVPGGQYDLRTFVADSDGSVSQISGSSILPVSGLSGN